MRAGRLLGLVAAGLSAWPAQAALTMQEVAECNAQAELFEIEMQGGVVIEVALFLYTIVVMHVLIEEWYVPALELVTSPDVLDVPRPLLGCTIMAAGNCLPELSMSLAALLLSESQDIGTGEVFGSCVFDLLGILGVVGLLSPDVGGIRIAPPLLLYFCGWVAVCTLADASLFFADDETMWPASLTMLTLYVAFVVGAFACWRIFPGFVGDDEVASRAAAAPGLTLARDGGGAGAAGEATAAAAAGKRSPPPHRSLRPSAPDDMEAGGSCTAAATGAGDARGSASALVAPATAAAGVKASWTPTLASPPASPPPPPPPSSTPSGKVAAAPRESTPLLKSPASAVATKAASVSPAGGGGGGAACARAAAEAASSVDKGGLAARSFDALAAPPRAFFAWTVPRAHGRMALLGGRRPWGLTLLVCMSYTLLLSYAMVQIAMRAICLVGVRKNALGATVLCLAAGFPDLITAMVLVRRPGMQTMAAANPFGAFLFNALVALGLPWAILGTYADIFPPARGTWYPSLVGFGAIVLALLAILANGLRLTRGLGVGLLTLYAAYLFAIINDSAMRPARPPA